MRSPPAGLRRFELLASLSLATDLGTGQPLGHGLRTCLLASDAARLMGLDSGARRAVVEVVLLRFLGCTADARETAVMAGGDDLAFNARLAPVLNGPSTAMLRELLGAVSPDSNAVRRAWMFLVAVIDPGEPARGLAAHCEVAAMLARRLGVADRVVAALGSAYERWDGNGYPQGLSGEEVPIEIRIAMVARDVDLLVHGGADVSAVLGRRRNHAYAPEVVDVFCAMPTWKVEADWDRIVELGPQEEVQDLGRALSALADFADLKSPWLLGHSRSVAGLAERATIAAGSDLGHASRMGWAGLVHDIGRVGVENGVWDEPGSLSVDQAEKVRLHPYLTERVLSRCSALADLGRLASAHHERQDGSGYHRGLAGVGLRFDEQVLAAADVLSALRSERPHRPGLEFGAASRTLRDEVRSGRLDARAVECVIEAAGGERRSVDAEPHGLTEREREVIRFIASGFTNRQTAERLFISAKTVGRHVENIYAKIGVSSRAAAAVYAMEHGLLD